MALQNLFEGGGSGAQKKRTPKQNFTKRVASGKSWNGYNNASEKPVGSSKNWSGYNNASEKPVGSSSGWRGYNNASDNPVGSSKNWSGHNNNRSTNTTYSNSKGQTRRASGIALDRLVDRGSGTPRPTKLVEVSADEYDRMSLDQRAVIDVNTLLQQSVLKDRASGTTVNTDAVLSFLGVKNDKSLPMSEYQNNRGYITQNDIELGRGQVDGPGRRPDPDSDRRRRQNTMVGSMANISYNLDQGAGSVGGRLQPLNTRNISSDQLAKFVDTLRKDFAAGKDLNTLAKPGGKSDIDFGALVNDGDLEQIVSERPDYNDVYTKMSSANVDPSVYFDEDFMRQVLEPDGIYDYAAWQRFVKAKQAMGG